MLILTLNYFFINSSLVEGFEYRKFIKDLKKNYIYGEQTAGIFYAANDLHDHIEDFYWQNKRHQPFCQLKKVTPTQCQLIQKSEKNYIIIVGKNLDMLAEEFGLDIAKENITKEEVELTVKVITSFLNKQGVQNYKIEDFYQSQYYFLLKFEIIKGDNFHLVGDLML